MKDIFADYHPFINLIYFSFVIGVSMFLMHPVYLFISLAGAMFYACLLTGIRKTLKNFLLFTLPLMVFVALLNPMFNHYGVTILFYLYNGNAVTLESMVYGLAMAVMLCSVILWFQCFHQVMTSDKLIYLFGRLIPSLSLILSMCMRFIPRFQKRAEVISNGQKCIGRGISSGRFTKKVKNGITILSILVTWSLENAIQTADSMKSRGFGLKGRTAFSIYSMDRRDKRLLLVMLLLSLIFFSGCIKGQTWADYDPRIVITGVPLTVLSCLTMTSYALFALLPVILSFLDQRHWAGLQKEITKSTKASYRLWEV